MNQTTRYQPTSSEEPPIYDENLTAQNTNEDKPPTYDSLINQLKNAKENSKNPVDLTKAVAIILTGSIVGTVSIGLLTAIPIAALIVGIVYRDNCSMESKIPLWLIITGAGGILSSLSKTIINAIENIKKRSDPNYKCGVAPNCLSCILTIFLFAWFFAGNFWVYSNYNHVQYTNTTEIETYCNKVIYLFSFWYITLTWILLALVCLCFCSIIVCLTSVACCLN